MRVLFICPVFYDYHRMLEAALAEKAEVESIFYSEEDLFSVKGIKKVVIFLLRFAYQVTGLSFFEKMKIRSYLFGYKGFSAKLSVLTPGAKNFDCVLVVKGFGLDCESLSQLRAACPNSIFRLYQWDSFGIYDSVLNTLSFYDSVFSFQRSDAEKFSISYFPNPHFCDLGQLDNLVRGEVVGVAFVGIFSIRRYFFLKRVASQCRRLGVSYEFRLFTRNRMWLSLDRSIIKGEKMTHFECEKLYKKMGAVLDLGQPNQSGITQRFFQGLAIGCKIVTSSRDYQALDSAIQTQVIHCDDFFSGMWFDDVVFTDLVSALSCYSSSRWAEIMLEGNKK